MKILMTMTGEKNGLEITVNEGDSYAEILRMQNMNPQAFLVFVNGVPRPHDAPAGNGETMEVLPVFSGG